MKGGKQKSMMETLMKQSAEEKMKINQNFRRIFILLKEDTVGKMILKTLLSVIWTILNTIMMGGIRTVQKILASQWMDRDVASLIFMFFPCN